MPLDSVYLVNMIGMSRLKSYTDEPSYMFLYTEDSIDNLRRSAERISRTSWQDANICGQGARTAPFEHEDDIERVRSGLEFG